MTDVPVMNVYEDLTEEECYLYAILSDVSGLDQAEFTWVEPDAPDGCFRCWPFQWKWFRNVEPLQIDQCARSVGKSMSIKMRAFAFPFVHPGKEMVITGPEGVHVDAITDLVETQFYSTRIGREMLVGGRFGVKHKPFHMNFANGARIMGRIPQSTGKGVKGIHPIWLELDEAQDYPPAGWTELVETLKRGFDGAVWRAHGVTRGVRDKFYEFTDDTNPNNDWKVHRFTAMHRPNWTDAERQEKIKAYGGSKEDPDYRRNVLGKHGDATNPIFVLTRLMRCVDDDLTSEYNNDEYLHLSINDNYVEQMRLPIADLIDLPQRHISNYRTTDQRHPIFWIGMDVGYTRDPSEILVFVQHRPTRRYDRKTGKTVAIVKDEQKSVLKLVTRISLKRIGAPQQVDVIEKVIEFYRPAAFAMDSTGAGLPLYQILQDRDAGVLKNIKGYNFSAKVLVDIDEGIEVDEFYGDPVKEAGIQKNVLEYATDKLRELVDTERIMLPWDKNLIGQFQGANEEKARQRGQDQYGRTKIYSGGEDHGLDAARMAAMGWAQNAIEEMTKQEKQAPVLDTFYAY